MTSNTGNNQKTKDKFARRCINCALNWHGIEWDDNYEEDNQK